MSTTVTSLLTIPAVCSVCERRHHRRADPMGFIEADPDDDQNWALDWSPKRLGRDDAAGYYNRFRGASSRKWGRLKVVGTVVGPRMLSGKLRPPLSGRLRLRCPIGHMLSPVWADLEARVTDAVARRLPYVEIPEQ